MDQPEATVQFVDLPGPTQYVTAIVNLGPHQPGRSYTFHFRYWRGDTPGHEPSPTGPAFDDVGRH